MPCDLKYSIFSKCVFYWLFKFHKYAKRGYCFKLIVQYHEATKYKDMNEVDTFFLEKSEFLKCSKIETPCCYANTYKRFLTFFVGWLDEAKVSCILRYQGVKLILAYSWARPAILAAGKSLLYYLFLLSSPFLWETTQNDPQGLTCRQTLRNQYRTIDYI